MNSLKERILITGAGGFIGSHLVTYFSNLEYEIYATFRNNKPQFNNNKIQLVKLDLPDTASIDFEYDYLIHCGADTSATTNNEENFIDSNIIGSKKIFKNAIEHGARAIINLSSMSIYGDIKTDCVRESDQPINPNKYGASKLEAENTLAELANNNKSLAAVSIRLPGVVGHGSHNNFLSRLISDIILEKDIIIKNPNPSDLFNNIIHVNDLSDYINYFINGKIYKYAPVNIAASCPIPLSTAIQKIFELVGKLNSAKYINEGKKSFQISIDNITSQGFHLRSTEEMIKSFVSETLKRNL
tara:strand:+ start:138 stop:1037 length:900 start_codon:yes stop_codon:yes gene_type:complete